MTAVGFSAIALMMAQIGLTPTPLSPSTRMVMIFAIGPNPVGFGTSQQFDIYNNGDNTFDVGFFGKADPGVAPAYYAYNIPVNFAVTDTDVSETPLPSTWTMMLIGLVGVVGLGFGAYRRQRQNAPMAA